MLTRVVNQSLCASRISFVVQIGGGEAADLEVLLGRTEVILQIVLPHGHPAHGHPVTHSSVYLHVAHSPLQEGPGPRGLAFRGNLGIKPLLEVPWGLGL